jgi:hypothetical protein
MTTKRGAKMTSGRPDPVLQRLWQCRLQRREILARCASREPHGLADRYSASLVISSAAGILAIDISDWIGAGRKIDRTAMARREQARMPESERVSAARRAFRSEALYTAVSSVRALLALSATSSVTTVKRARAAEPNVVEIATSAASRPRAMTIRPIRG